MYVCTIFSNKDTSEAQSNSLLKNKYQFNIMSQPEAYIKIFSGSPNWRISQHHFDGKHISKNFLIKCRDGFGLGLGKNLHGFPRYKIVGRTEEGKICRFGSNVIHRPLKYFTFISQLGTRKKTFQFRINLVDATKYILSCALHSRQ